MSVWSFVICTRMLSVRALFLATLRLTRRLDRLVHQRPTDEVVYTADLGLEYVVFNGAVPESDRLTKSYLARVNFCTMCAGNGKDNVMLVCFLSFAGGSGGLLPGVCTCTL